MKRKLLTALACLTIASSLLTSCTNAEKTSDGTAETEQSESVNQNDTETVDENQEETEFETIESETQQYEPTTVSDPDAPSFDDIYNANQLENILSVYDAIKYIESFNGEETDESEGTYVTTNGIYTPITLPGTEQSTDWEDMFNFDSEKEYNGYAFYNSNSYYVTDGTDFYAVLDTGDTYISENSGEYESRFYGWDSSDVESITRTETGWKIKFNPDENNAMFFRDEEYQEGDVFVTYEYVNENLILDYYTQVIECADGTVLELNKTQLIAGEIPEIAKTMSEHANPSEENIFPVIVFVDNGIGEVEAKRCFITYGDRCDILSDGYLIYADKDYTVSLENAESGDSLVVYAVSPISLFMSDTEILSIPDVIGYDVTAYDSDGNIIAKNSILNGTNWSSYDIGGNFYDESIAYLECTLFDENSEIIGETLTLNK